MRDVASRLPVEFWSNSLDGMELEVPLLNDDTSLSPGGLSKRARRLYPEKALAARLQTLRPYICNFDQILPLVPKGASVLDGGCGAGLFIGLLADLGLISGAVGFDSSAPAIALARRMQTRLSPGVPVEFLHIDATAPWPTERYDVVSLIDVLHHVPRAFQQTVLSNARECVKPGGVLLYKDMASNAHWRSWWNQAHDLILAQQWIHHVPISSVDAWAMKAGLRSIAGGSTNRYIYAHEWRVFRSPSP